MRNHRLLFLLGLAALVGLSLVYLRGPSPSSSNGYINTSPLPSPHPTPSSLSQVPPKSPERPPIPHDTSSSTTHPISTLVEDADRNFDQIRSRQSKTLSEAVTEYRRRYQMHPPPHFDKWFNFAKSKGVQLIDEYDTIYHSLLPFWSLEPKVIRQRARETLGFENFVLGVLIRNGKVTLADGGGDEKEWQRQATMDMMKDFVQYLPDMDLVFNIHDEPRVILASDDLQRLVSNARDHVLPNAFQNQSPRNAWSKKPADLNKGDRLDEVRSTRFNRYAHQQTWSDSRASCPVDSASRSLDDDPEDNTQVYARGELGFIYNTTAFSDICNTPSLPRKFGFFECANAFDVVHDLFPIFSQSKISSFQDILYPSPWYWAEKVPYSAELDSSWDSKIDRMYWRGSTTGGFSRAGGWRRQHRQRFVGTINGLDKTKILTKSDQGPWGAKEVSRKDYRDLFNVWFTYVGQCDPEDCAAQNEYFQVGEPKGQQEAWEHKHLVDIDGNAFSGRFYSFLLSNSLVHKVAIFREWHEEVIKPWVHYVPLSLEGNEYAETMRYLVHDDDGKKVAPKLAKQGQDWAQKALRKGDMEVWFFRLLLEYGRLVDDNREKLGYFV